MLMDCLLVFLRMGLGKEVKLDYIWWIKMKKIIKKYFTDVGGGCFVTTSKEGDCYAVTTTRPTREFSKRLTN